MDRDVLRQAFRLLAPVNSSTVGILFLTLHHEGIRRESRSWMFTINIDSLHIDKKRTYGAGRFPNDSDCECRAKKFDQAPIFALSQKAVAHPTCGLLVALFWSTAKTYFNVCAFPLLSSMLPRRP